MAAKKKTRLDLMGEYIREVADAMGLQGWSFAVYDGVESAESAMSVKVTDGRNEAVIGVGEAAWVCDREVLRRYVCHELLHCHIARLVSHLDDMRERFSDDVQSHLYDIHLREEEHAINGMHPAWAKTLPLPSPALRK